MSKKEEWTIMPPSPYYSTVRFAGSERNEVFGGTANRKKSIEDGLVIFLTPLDHRIGKHSFHLDPQNSKWKKVRKIAQLKWMEFYNKTEEQFIKRYGESYIHEVEDEDIY